jgi:hypothetical protein
MATNVPTITGHSGLPPRARVPGDGAVDACGTGAA